MPEPFSVTVGVSAAALKVFLNDGDDNADFIVQVCLRPGHWLYSSLKHILMYAFYGFTA